MLLVALMCTTIGCDQFTKQIAREKIEPNTEMNFLNDHFNLLRVENPGAFLSLGQNMPKPLRIILLTIIPILALAFAFLLMLTRKQLTLATRIGISLIIGGGIGNLYDRLLHGAVTDFMHIDFGIFQTGIFNMADVAIMTGLFLILLEMVLRKRNTAVS